MRRVLLAALTAAVATAKKTSDSTSSTLQTTESTPAVTLVKQLSFPSESSSDDNFPKLVFTLPSDDYYYNTNVVVGGESLELRLDLIQPEIWVMNDNFYPCDQVVSFYLVEFSEYGSLMPAEVTTDPLYLATACAEGGVYATSAEDQAQPTIPGLANGQVYTLPLLSTIDAAGRFETNNVTVVFANNQELTLPQFTFLDVDNTNMLMGGLGLAGNPTGSGFLDSLVQQGIIKSAGYSLWFSPSRTTDAVAEVMLGYADRQYFSGDLHSFPMIPYAGGKSNDYTDDLRRGLKLPTLLVTGIQVRNGNSNEKVSIMAGDTSLPVLLDLRSFYTYLPLEVIINLAIQLDAVYNGVVQEWIVECDKINSANAFLNFQFGELEVAVPMGDIISNATYNESKLTFSNGKDACYLMVLPSTLRGYSSLGLSFLRHAYIVVDNAGERIGVANARSLDVKSLDFSTLQLPSLLPTSSLGSITAPGVGHIMSGVIPFATSRNQSSTSITFSTAGADSQDIPERFIGAVILSGQIYLTAASASSAVASAADQLTSKMQSGSDRIQLQLGRGRSLQWVTQLLLVAAGMVAVAVVAV